MLKNNLKKLKGVYGAFALVEALLALSVLSLIVGSLVGVLIYGRESTALSGSRGRAATLAEEGLEAVRNIRDANFSNLVLGAHGLGISGNEWVFSGSSDTTGIFTRTVELSQVDANTIQVVSNISWQQNPQRLGTVSLLTYLTNWLTGGGGDWSNPKEESCSSLSGGQDALKVQLQGDFAYVVTKSSSRSFAVIDISDPTNPSFLVEASILQNPNNLAVSGNYAYVTTSSNSQELAVVDISTPSSPSVVGTFDAPGSADGLGVYVVGSRVYLVRASSSDNELWVIDVSNPSSPSSLGSLNLNGNGNEIAVLGNYAYIASSPDSQELQVVDISNPSSLSINGSYNLSGTSNALTTTGFDSTVILGRGNGEINIFNVSNPVSPNLLGSFNAQDSVNDLSLGNGNNYVFIASDKDSAEFQVIDISTPSSPTFVGSFDWPKDLNGVAYYSGGNMAAVVSDSNPAEFCIVSPQ